MKESVRQRKVHSEGCHSQVVTVIPSKDDGTPEWNCCKLEIRIFVKILHSNLLLLAAYHRKIEEGIHYSSCVVDILKIFL